MKKVSVPTISLLLGILLLSAPCFSYEMSGFCNVKTEIDSAWELPSDAAWHDLLVNTLTVPPGNASDLVVTTAVYIKFGSTPNARVAYRFLLDGVDAGVTFMRRTPDDFPSTQDIEVAFADVQPGDRTIRLQARNLDGLPVYYHNIWSNPVLVDAAETTVISKSDSSSLVYLDRLWKNAWSVSIDVPADRMLEVAAAFRVVSGPAGSQLQYRLVDGDKVLFLWNDSLPDAVPDGVHLTRYHTDPEPGQRTIELQVRAPGVGEGSTEIAVRNRYMFAQTMPTYQVFEATSLDKVSFPGDNAFHTVLESELEVIYSDSRGMPNGDRYFSFLGGHAFASLPPQQRLPVEWSLQLYEENYGWMPFDIGSHQGHTAAARKLVTGLAAGCGYCGWLPDARYKIALWARSRCDTGVALEADRTTLQILMLPSWPFFPSCGSTWEVCCQQAPNCTWECDPGGSLPVIHGLPPKDCSLEPEASSITVDVDQSTPGYLDAQANAVGVSAAYSPADAVNEVAPGVQGNFDDKWSAWNGLWGYNGLDVFTEAATEQSPTLDVAVNGLRDGSSYAVYGRYATVPSAADTYGLSMGLAPDQLEPYTQLTLGSQVLQDWGLWEEWEVCIGESTAANDAAHLFLDDEAIQKRSSFTGMRLELAEPCPRFLDVPNDHWAFLHIDTIARAGVTAGCSTDPPLYCPSSLVNRAQMAVFIIASMGEEPSTAANDAYFDDLDGYAPYAPNINRIKELGITSGCGTRQYCPGAPVLRKQMAVFIIKAIGESGSTVPYNEYFDDIDDDGFAPAINRVYELGITTGCGTRTYCPSESVSRAQMAVFITKAFFS